MKRECRDREEAAGGGNGEEQREGVERGVKKGVIRGSDWREWKGAVYSEEAGA